MEFKNCEVGPRRLTIATIGGRFTGNSTGDPFYRRLARSYVAAYTGKEDNDLVVTYASATAAGTTGLLPKAIDAITSAISNPISAGGRTSTR